ncbi:tetraspanin-19-like [Phalaenopsis equestris]|uniref:tetraspanin-19-like n=1 Tax=Phalaenopsis equestris TaxID=78828 RepID=UPI0009E3F2E0|nr:tetraspanin-19-like [Phalaenopsis equestris]
MSFNEWAQPNDVNFSSFTSLNQILPASCDRSGHYFHAPITALPPPPQTTLERQGNLRKRWTTEIFGSPFLYACSSPLSSTLTKSTPWIKVCLQSTLKMLNSVMGLLGMAVIMYSLWMIRSCLRQLCEFSRNFSESSSSPSWFVFTFLGLGIFLCVLTCSGHIAAETINSHCLSCYSVFLFFLLVLEASITADVFLNKNWEEAFPHDRTGSFNRFKEFVGSNSGLCKWIGLLVLAVQVLSIFTAMVLRALGPEHRLLEESDDDDDVSLPAMLPLLKNQTHIMADRKFPGSNASWIIRIPDVICR